MKSNHRRTLALALSLIAQLSALSFLPSCSRRESVIESGLRTQILHIGSSSDPDSLDPHVSSSFVNTHRALFEGLVNVANDGTTLLPGVAERWQVSPDGITYTFHLRTSARWSNGDPLTAEDFVASFQRILEPALAGGEYAFPIVGARDYHEGRTKDPSTIGVRAPDLHTLVITLTQRSFSFPLRLGSVPFYPVHRPSIDRVKGWTDRESKWTKPGLLVSNGPFQLTALQPGVVLVATKNPHYWNAAHVRLREIRFHPIEDAAVEEREFRTGQLHVTNDLTPAKCRAYRDRSAPELSVSSMALTTFIRLNTTKPPFQDARVRRAMSLAIDREALATQVAAGFALRAESMTMPGVGGYEPPKLFRHDPAEARRLLAEAGHAGGRGLPHLEWMLAGKDREQIRFAEAVQEMWRKELGVAVALTTVDPKVYYDQRRTGNYQLALSGWDYWTNDPADFLEIGTSGFGLNQTGWSNSEYDRLYAAANHATSEAERRAAFDGMETMLANEMPIVPLIHPQQTHLVHPSVRGWRENLCHVIDWRELWLEAAK